MKKNTPATSRHYQRARNRAQILDLIRTAELISRTDLSKKTGLSQASITNITSELIKENLIEEKQAGAYVRGRRPMLLAINPDGVHVVGVNMSQTQIRIVIINFSAEVKVSYILPLKKKYYPPEEIVEIIARGIQACIWEVNFSKDQIAGVGVGIPGPVDSVSGLVHFLPNYGWENVPFREMLKEKLNHPVFIDNSSNNLAIAEYWYGDGKGIDNFLLITLENGVGAGAIVNGQLMRGDMGLASEFGHTCIDPDGPYCRCGRKGCIEAYSGNYSIIEAAKKLVKKGEWGDSGAVEEDIGFREVITELNRGNTALKEIYKTAGEVLGRGVFNLITLYSPRLVIITGKGVAAGDSIFGPMYSTIKELKRGRFASKDTDIMIHSWNESNWARGGGTLVLREIYKSPGVQ